MNTPALPARLAPEAHKGEAGRVLCLAGSASMPGAALLCARAAQRAGAGLVVMGCLDAALLTLLPAAAPEAVLLDLCTAFELGGRVRGEVGALLRARAPHAALLGPGLGDDARTRALLALVLSELELPLVLDADGLNALAGEPERLRAARASTLVLTPHPGEAARLLGRELSPAPAWRLAAARELSQRSGAVVCLKGRGTVVVAPGGEAWVCPAGNPGLATAGTGDVLAGVLVAYLARAHSVPRAGYGAFEAACAAVFVHALAGDLGAARLGERALIASDLVAELAAAQRRCEEPGASAGSA